MLMKSRVGEIGQKLQNTKTKYIKKTKASTKHEGGGRGEGFNRENII